MITFSINKDGYAGLWSLPSVIVEPVIRDCGACHCGRHWDNIVAELQKNVVSRLS